MKKKGKSRAVVFPANGTGELLPGLRVVKGTRRQLDQEAAREGITVTAYMKSCLWLGRQKKGNLPEGHPA